MLRIEVVNDGTGTESSANYDYRVYVNRELIARGRVEGHNRKDGWRALLAMVGMQAEPDEIDAEIAKMSDKEIVDLIQSSAGMWKDRKDLDDLFESEL